MPYPIQPVTAFSEAELWYMYQQLIEINTNTSGGSGLTQNELYEVFNGTNPEGFAASLFESLSGGDTPLSNLFVDTLSGATYSIANLNFLQLQSLSSIDTNCASIQTNTLNSANSLSNIDADTTSISNHTGAVRGAVLTSITGSLTVAPVIHNISVYNSGAAAGTINVNGGGAISIPAGVTVNFDAGGNNNRYAANTFVLNATGTTFIVSYTT